MCGFVLLNSDPGSSEGGARHTLFVCLFESLIRSGGPDASTPHVNPDDCKRSREARKPCQAGGFLARAFQYSSKHTPTKELTKAHTHLIAGASQGEKPLSFCFVRSGSWHGSHFSAYPVAEPRYEFAKQNRIPIVSVAWVDNTRPGLRKQTVGFRCTYWL